MAKVEIVQYGPFEIEVGSRVYERLVEQDKLTGHEPVNDVDIEPDEGSVRVEDPDNLGSLTRGKLNEKARKAGIEDPTTFKTKDEVIAAIEAAAKGGTLGE